jgi:hypothetical protein
MEGIGTIQFTFTSTNQFVSYVRLGDNARQTSTRLKSYAAAQSASFTDVTVDCVREPRESCDEPMLPDYLYDPWFDLRFKEIPLMQVFSAHGKET